MITPFERAEGIYLKSVTKRSFETELRLYHQNGFVYSTPTSFLMGRPVCHDWSYADLSNPAKVARGEADCWWIGAAAGDMKEFMLLHQPFHLKFYGWEKNDGRARVWHAQRVWDKLGIWDGMVGRFKDPE